MNKYQLFSDHQNQELYGMTIKESLFSQPIKMADKQDGEKEYGNRMVANWVHVDSILIDEILAIENDPDSKRGNQEYLRAICKSGNRIVTIDYHQIEFKALS